MIFDISPESVFQTAAEKLEGDISWPNQMICRLWSKIFMLRLDIPMAIIDLEVNGENWNALFTRMHSSRANYLVFSIMTLKSTRPRIAFRLGKLLIVACLRKFRILFIMLYAILWGFLVTCFIFQGLVCSLVMHIVLSLSNFEHNTLAIAMVCLLFFPPIINACNAFSFWFYKIALLLLFLLFLFVGVSSDDPAGVGGEVDEII